MASDVSNKSEVEELKKRLLELREERKKLERQLDSTIDKYFPPLSDGPDNAEALIEDKKRYYERMGNLILLILHPKFACHRYYVKITLLNK